MKKVLLTLAAVGLATSIYAQGTVSFNNYVGATGLVKVGDNVSSAVVVPASSQITVQLLYVPQGTALGSLTPWSTVFTTTLAQAGKFYDGATKALPGIALGATATLAVQGWTGAYASMAEAVTAGVNVGKTLAFDNPTGGAGTPPGAPMNLTGWLDSNPLILLPVPEPSTFALLGLGVLGLFTLRRK
jgi:hypothetical protein